MFQLLTKTFLILIILISLLSCKENNSEFDKKMYLHTFENTSKLIQYGDFNYYEYSLRTKSYDGTSKYKLEYILKTMKKINQKTDLLIHSIEKIKSTICSENYETPSPYETNSITQIQIKNFDLAKVKNKVIDNEKIKFQLKQLINKIYKYRRESLETFASYRNSYNSKFYFKDPNYNAIINDYILENKLDTILNLKTTNYWDDGYLIKLLYQKFNEINNNLKKEINSSSFSSIHINQLMCDLMIIEKKIISIRNSYILHLKYSSSYCGPAFETPLVTTEGPSIVKNNKEYLVKINYAFVRNYSNTDISISTKNNIKKLKRGVLLTQKMEKNNLIFKGELISYKKSGEIKIIPFSKNVKCYINSTK